MRLLLTVLGFFCAFTLAHADGQKPDPTIEITSFGPVDSRVSLRIGEVCGRVTGMTAAITPVRITVDPNLSSPGIYNTFVTSDGQFCQVVSTLTGTLKAEVVTSGKKISAKAQITRELR